MVGLLHDFVQALVMMFVITSFLAEPMCLGPEIEQKGQYLRSGSRRNVGKASLPPAFLNFGFVN